MKKEIIDFNNKFKFKFVLFKNKLSIMICVANNVNY